MSSPTVSPLDPRLNSSCPILDSVIRNLSSPDQVQLARLTLIEENLHRARSHFHSPSSIDQSFIRHYVRQASALISEALQHARDMHAADDAQSSTIRCVQTAGSERK